MVGRRRRRPGRGGGKEGRKEERKQCHYWLLSFAILHSCEESGTGPVSMDGYFLWKNPYGHLSIEFWPYYYVSVWHTKRPTDFSLSVLSLPVFLLFGGCGSLVRIICPTLAPAARPSNLDCWSHSVGDDRGSDSLLHLSYLQSDWWKM